MNLASVCLEPAYRVLVPSTYADTEAALTYWLSNPLLPAKRVQLTHEQLPTMGKADKQALVQRLIKAVERLRELDRYDANGYNLLLKLVRHELIDTDERVSLKPHFLRLRGAEIEWEYTRLEAAIKAREEAAYPQEAAA